MKKRIQYKKPSEPFKVREDGHSYAQCLGGPWNGLWVWYFGDHQDLDMAGDIYKFRVQVGEAEDSRKGDYVHDKTEVE